MELALDPRVLDQQTNRLDLPLTFGGAGTHLLINYDNEEFLGSFTAIASALISFYRKTNLPVFSNIAEALEELDAP